MRSRPEITVFLDPAEPRAGETLRAEARLLSTSDTPLDRVVFTLTGIERIQIGKHAQQHEHVRLVADVPGAPLTPGTHTYRARFDLPAGLPPRYLGRVAKVDYVLEVRADIPWWPDGVGRFVVPVALPPGDAGEHPCVFASAKGGAQGSEPYAELSLASTVVEPGGALVGSVAITHAAQARGATVALVAYERSFRQGLRYEAARREILLSEAPPGEGASLPFRMALGRELVPGFDAKLSALEWAAEVTIRGRFLRRALISASIRVVPHTGARPPRRGAVPAVGHERRLQTFAAVAERLGLDHDAEHEDLRGTFGAVSLRADVESRPDGSLATVAHLAWPPLGMGLCVGPGSWTDLVSRREIDVGVAGFDRRFHVESRFPAQARALLDADVCALLSGFADARMDDEGATLAVATAIADEAPLLDFVRRAGQAARAIDAAFDRVPLPPPIAEGAEAWRAEAERLGGRLERGRGAIHDGALGQERVSIETRWAEDGAFEATVVRVPLDVRVDPEAISSPARAQAASIGEQAGGEVAIAEDAVTLTLPRPLPDPRVLDPAIEGLAHLVHAVRRRGEAGPFRS